MGTRFIPSEVTTPALPSALVLQAHLQASRPGTHLYATPEIAAHRQTRYEQHIRVKLNLRYSREIQDYSQALLDKDPQLYRHSQRVLSLTLRLTRVLDMADEETLEIALAAFLHDVGKIVIGDDVLRKPTRLTPGEYAIMQQHPAYGARLLESCPSLRPLAPLLLYHHERWDGQGYPFGLAGMAIPQGARIIAITDAFEAMTARRPYQPQRTPRAALEELYRCAGTQFDAPLVKLFCGQVFYSVAGDAPGIS